MQRIAVMGNAGTGKSYLARKLSDRLGVPILDLDDLFWKPPGQYSTRRPADELMALIDRERRKPSWIVEGVYGELLARFLDEAQQLLWLDMPWEVSYRRLQARQQHERPSRPDSLETLVAYARNYWQRTDGRSHVGHASMFEAFSGEKRRFLSQDQVNHFLSWDEPQAE